MQKKQYIGSYVDIEKAKEFNWNIEDDYIESPIVDSYSVELVLEEMKIKDVLRVEHCHLCGGQGSDSYINRFPNWVEVAIETEMMKLICTREHVLSIQKSIKDQLDREKQEELMKAEEAEEKRIRDTDPNQCPTSLLRNLADKVTHGVEGEISLFIRSCIQAGIGRNMIINDGLIRGYCDSLKLLHSQKIYPPEAIMSLNAFQVGLNILGSEIPVQKVNKKISVSFIRLKYLGRINPLFAHYNYYDALSLYGYILEPSIPEILFEPSEVDYCFVNNITQAAKAINTELIIVCPWLVMNDEHYEKIEVLIANSNVKQAMLADTKYDPLALIKKMDRHCKRLT